MANLFNSIIAKKPKSNAFNLSYDKKISLKFGQLIPIHLQETIPGDIFRGKTQVMMRLAPMLAPVMHQVELYCHFFFVPNRILWDNWEAFITGQDTNSGIPEPPYILLSAAKVENGSLGDHLGLPSSDITQVTYTDGTPAEPERQFNALPFAAYQRIWWEYYRDENLEFPTVRTRSLTLPDGVVTPPGDGSYTDLHQIRYRAWQKDYFASALPFAQQGAEMLIPFGFDEDVPVYTDVDGSGDFIRSKFANVDGTHPATNQTLQSLGTTGNLLLAQDVAPGAIDAEGSGLMARTSGLTLGSGSVEELRTALEKNARGGTRYVESILSHFGVRVKDYRLDRPEYIGGGKNLVQISEVLQTAEPADPMTQTPLATMAGHGISAGYAGTYNYRAPEHGFIVGIMSVRPKPAYYMGVPRHFLQRKDRLDYYWPSFAHLGEQPIIETELLYDGLQIAIDGEAAEFGYTPRYAEYRKNYSTVAGDFNTSLDFWHLGRKFPSMPLLNNDFTRVNSPDITTEMDRIFAVQDGTDYFWAHIVHDIKAIRPMPRFAIPRT